MFRQFKNIMLKGIMLFALFCILPIMAANAADNEANPFEGKIYESDYAYFENAVAVNHVSIGICQRQTVFLQNVLI